MMLALAGLITVILVLVAIMSKRVAPLVALIGIPFATSLLCGNGLATADYMVQGITKIAPVAVMFVFAILYFGLMNDAGVFTPIIDRILRAAGSDPRKILVGTALLTACVHLDGSGATTFLIAVPALLPLYDRLGIERKILTCTVAMAAGVNNLLPWGGPTLRAAAALDMPVMEIYRPLIPVHLAGFAFVLLAAFWLGAREKNRLGAAALRSAGGNDSGRAPELSRKHCSRPLFFINIALTIAIVGLMIASVLPPVVAFMLGVVLALTINFPSVVQQREHIDAHARAAMMMAGILFAAGAFSGILSGSGMLDAMAKGGAEIVPHGLASHMPALLGVVSMPLSFLFDPDSFYFGILPVLAGVAAEFGVRPEAVAQGALLGQMTTGFPVSPLTPATFLLVGLAGVNLGEHQRFATPFLFAASLVMTAAGLFLGVFDL